MTRNETGAGRSNGTTPGDCQARQLDTSNNSAARSARQVSASSRSILSIDDGEHAPWFAAAWLARRGRVTLHHAAALAEAHGIGGVS